jgi:uncharacterized surface protein with fasciclin (FAS1) repeats
MTSFNRNSWKRTALAVASGLVFSSAALAQSDVDPKHSTFPQSQVNAGSQGVARGASQMDRLAAEHAELATFASALKVSGLESSLTNGKDFTVFAPTNEALDSKPGKNIDTLLEPKNRDELISFLRAHIVADQIDLQGAPRAEREARTIDGEAIEIERDKGEITVAGAKVVNANGISLGNLKIYAVDDVLARNGKPIEEEQVHNRNSSAVAPGRTPGLAGENPN